MSTHTEKPPVQPARPGSPHDEFGGAFGFFRKYQKLILYTAGIFALVTFSITTSVSQFFGNLADKATGPLPTIEVEGRTVPLTTEDLQFGNLLARNYRATYVMGIPRVMPEIGHGSVSSDLSTCFAILRRASIEAGLDVSLTEVDRSIDWMVRAWNAISNRTDNATQLALAVGMTSLAQYRELVKEAMRIGNYVRLNSIGVDSSDAALLNGIIEGQEKISVRAALFDKKAKEEQLKAEQKVGDEELRAWFDKLEEKDKNPLQVYDTNKVSLLLGAIGYADFKAEEWPEELKEFKFGEEQQKLLYEAVKATRFKGEKDGEFKPREDAAVQDELQRLAQVEEVLNRLLARLRERLGEALKEPNDELARATAEQTPAQQDRDAAKTASEAKPDDEELKQKLRQAEEVLTAKENAMTAAKAALEAARKGFDLRAAFTELVKDADGNPRAGCAVVEVVGPKNAKELEDLGEDLGAWDNPKLATNLQNAGELGGAPARAAKAGFVFQVTEVVVRPLKPWDEIKEKVEEAWYIDRAKTIGQQQKEAFEAALLRLAKEKIPDKLAEIEGRRSAEIDKRFTEWESKLQADLQRADEWLAKLTPGTRAYKSYETLKADSQAHLDKKDDQRRAIEEQVGKDLEAEVKAEARKQYGTVLEPAAQEAGFTISTLPPYSRQLAAEPWFVKRFEKTVVFLWGGPVNNLKVGEVTDVVEDTQNRTWLMAVCDQVEPRTWDDVSRREFAGRRMTFGLGQVTEAIRQAFTLEALKERYNYKLPEGKQVEDRSEKPKTPGNNQDKPGDK